MSGFLEGNHRHEKCVKLKYSRFHKNSENVIKCLQSLKKNTIKPLIDSTLAQNGRYGSTA